MDIYYIGATAPTFDFTLKNKKGVVIPVTGGTFTVTFRDKTTGTKTTGQGTPTLIDGTNGKWRYTLHANDLSNTGAGIKEVFCQIIVGSNIYKPKPVTIDVRAV